ncbi:MAG: elongation factor G [Halothece sp. Uz-M2-17]|nr:elongation factor G [Halothece sp. Uz-M2-17]
MNGKVSRNFCNIAIVGPASSGKTTLLESLLFVSGAIKRKGNIKQGNTVGDNLPEARDRAMTVEINTAYTTIDDLQLTFLDCPGAIEFAQETQNALVGVDAAIVVCEPTVERVLTLAPILKFLDDWEIPHFIFLNKMDRANHSFTEILTAIKAVSPRPLLPQQYPLYQGQTLLGFIDLITEQAYQYHAGTVADPVEIPATVAAEEKLARDDLLEGLAEFDDHLLEELLEDINPSLEEIRKDLKEDISSDLIVPVCFGIAEQDYGIRPLLSTLVSEIPASEVTTTRRGIDPKAESPTIVQVLKTYYSPQGGKLSLIRIWQGRLTSNMTLNGVRPGGMYRLLGQDLQAILEAFAGDIVALSRLEGIQTGETLSSDSDPESLPTPEKMSLVYALAISTKNRKDEVKLTAAVAKLLEEDPALSWEQNGDTQEILLWGQGDIHLQVALDRLHRKYNLSMTTQSPHVPYRETIRQETQAHGRYKHQTGGHGAFGEVYLDIQPLPRGEGFQFQETIVGGAIPKQYISGVQTGVEEYLNQGPLGFPVIDIAVTLTNGSFHSVDSSEQAFKQAARIAMSEGMPNAEPILLEPILEIKVYAPSDFTSNVLQLVSGHRGQIMGYQSCTDWLNWDEVTAYLPQAEMQNFIVELRSLTLGVGFFNWQPHHLQEVPEKNTQQVLANLEAG